MMLLIMSHINLPTIASEYVYVRTGHVTAYVLHATNGLLVIDHPVVIYIQLLEASVSCVFIQWAMDLHTNNRFHIIDICADVPILHCDAITLPGAQTDVGNREV